MRIKYFADTDTALFELNEHPVAETRQVGEDVFLDLDADGNLVSMTVEHARNRANLSEIAFLDMKTA